MSQCKSPVYSDEAEEKTEQTVGRIKTVLTTDGFQASLKATVSVTCSLTLESQNFNAPELKMKLTTEEEQLSFRFFLFLFSSLFHLSVLVASMKLAFGQR